MLSSMTFSFVLSLLIGCGPKTAEMTDNPRQEFVTGVSILRSADRKTGSVDYEAAYERFWKSSELDPNFHQAHYNAGWTAEQLSRFADAERHYRNAYNLLQNTDYLLALADTLSKNDKSAEAVELYKSYLSNNADKTIRYKLIEAMTAAGQYEDAIVQIQQILLTEPKDIKAYQLLSRVYFVQDMFDMSLLCAEKANEFAEGDPGISNNMGVTYLAMKDETTALVTFKEIVDQHPDHLSANLNLGYIALNSGDFALAQARFDAALQKDPTNNDAKLGLAIALRGLLDYKAAGKLYDELLKSDNPPRVVYFNASTLYEKYTKDFKKAEEYIQLWISKNPNDTEAMERVAQIQESIRIEEERRRQEEELRRQEEERQKRQKEAFDKLKGALATLKADITALSSCADAADSIEMAGMYGEQAQMVVDEQDIEMAGDMTAFVEEAQSMLDAVKSPCGISGGAPEGEGAPAEDTPAEEAPAE